MPVLIPSSRLFGELFGTDAMRALFDDKAMVTRYLDVEAALARAQGRLGVIPEEAAKAISTAAIPEVVDWQLLGARTEVVGYPIMPLVNQLSDRTPDGHGQYCHWGATTQDIMDTADVLQMRDALDLIADDLDGGRDACAGLAETYADTPMAGRTHLQHAMPISFGLKITGWLSALDRHRERLDELRPRLEVVQFAGAAGTLASLGKDGLSVRAALADELDLGVTAVGWHTARDNFAEALGFLAMLSGTLGKIGTDIALMMQSETGEVLEPYVPGRGGSSTMPQKRNPIAAEVMIAAAKVVRVQQGLMLDAMVQDHERATGPWQAEWQAIPQAFIATSGALKAARETLDGLEVRPDAMLKALEATGGLVVAEAVMMVLAPELGRTRAHDLVETCCRRALEEDVSFLDALCADPIIMKCTSRAHLAEVIDPANHLGRAPDMVHQYLASRGGDR